MVVDVCHFVCLVVVFLFVFLSDAGNVLQLHVVEQARLWGIAGLLAGTRLLHEAVFFHGHGVVLMGDRQRTLLEQPRIRILGLFYPQPRNMLLVGLRDRTDFITHTHFLERKSVSFRVGEQCEFHSSR